MLLSDVCLSDVCLSRTSGVTREQRGVGRPLARTGSPRTSHVTRTPLSRSKGQRSRSPALLSAALTRKAAAAVSVGRIRRGKVYRYVASARRRARASAPTGGGREGRGHNVSPRAQLVFSRFAIRNEI